MVLANVGSRSGLVGTLPAPARLVGLRDFNADGKDDALWRTADDHLEIWFSG